MTSFPPRHICIVGAIAITVGVGAWIGMIAGLITGEFDFDIGIVGIPIGYGLLIGRSSSRGWAIFFGMVGFVLIAGFEGWLCYRHFTGKDPLPYPDGAYTAAELVVALTCCIYVVVVLSAKVASRWFEGTVEDRESSKSFTWAVAVSSAVLLFSFYAMEWWIEETHANIFPVRVTVAPYDSQNGEDLTSLRYEFDEILHRNDSMPDLPKVGVSFRSSREGTKLEFSGVAVRPVGVTIQSEGYQDFSMTLDQDSDYEIRIGMLPLTNRKNPRKTAADDRPQSPSRINSVKSPIQPCEAREQCGTVKRAVFRSKMIAGISAGNARQRRMPRKRRSTRHGSGLTRPWHAYDVAGEWSMQERNASMKEVEWV